MAFDLPELMGRETWFNVLGNGYEVYLFYLFSTFS
jgi:hypothetical protein